MAKRKFQVGDIVECEYWWSSCEYGVIIEYDSYYTKPYLVKKLHGREERISSGDLRKCTIDFTVGL
jgi:hypothetical protein